MYIYLPRLTLLARDLSLLDSTVGALLKLGPSLTQHTSALPSMSLCLIGHEIISGFLKENDYPNIYSFLTLYVPFWGLSSPK